MNSIVFLLSCVLVVSAVPHMLNTHDKAAVAIKALPVSPRDDIPADCLSSIEELQNLADTCTFPDFNADLEADLDTFCDTAASTSCTAAYLTTLLNDISSECVGYVDDYTDLINTVQQSVSLMCLQMDGEYCAVDVYSVATQDWSAGVTEENLELFCSDCVRYYWSTAVSYATDGTELEDYVSDIGVCMKDGDHWCALDLVDINTAFEAGDWATGADLACSSQCVPRYLQLNEEYATDFTAAYDVLCYRNEDGDLCFPIVATAAEDTDILDVCSLWSISEDCLTAFQTVIDESGCCFLSLFNFITDDTVVTFIDTVLEDLGIEMPAECPVSLGVSFTFEIANLDPNWLSENWDEIKDAIIQDFALNTGIDVTAIEAELPEDISEVATIIITCFPSSDEGAQTLVDSLVSLIESYGYTLYNTAAAVPPSGRVTPTEGLAASTGSAVNTFSIDGSYSSAMYPAIATLVSLVFALLQATFGI